MAAGKFFNENKVIGDYDRFMDPDSLNPDTGPG
jgi:hypothetical protein